MHVTGNHQWSLLAGYIVPPSGVISDDFKAGSRESHQQNCGNST
jgi:hypothetical protein